MCLHLRKVQPDRTHADKTMIYQHINPVKVDAKRMNRPQLPIAGCMKQHVLDYKPGNLIISPGARKYCIQNIFVTVYNVCNCLKMSETSSESIPPVRPVCHEDECDLDADDIDQNEKVFEFVTIPSFVALVSGNSNEAVYILKDEEKEIAEEKSWMDMVILFPLVIALTWRCNLYTGRSVRSFC